MPRFLRVIFRTMVASLALGLVAYLLSFTVGWYRSCKPENLIGYRSFYHSFENKVQELKLVIEYWKDTHDGSLPESLKELIEEGSTPAVEKEFQERITDPWDNPIVYKVGGDDYELISYGADGKPGGRWIDCDLSSRGPFPPENFSPSFRRFYSSELSTPVLWTSAFTGVLIFLFSLFYFEVLYGRKRSSDESPISEKEQTVVLTAKLASMAMIVFYAVLMSTILSTCYLTLSQYRYH